MSEQEINNGLRWYVIHTYSGYENKVKTDIEKMVDNRGLNDLVKEVSVPLEDVVEVKENGQRIIAVGTTSTRTLEANMKKYGKFTSVHENTDIFIYPGYKYEAIDCLITNFHLPKSTLLMLISAFASKEFIFKAYQEAIDEKYRFFSFGDSMFIM